MVTIVWTLFILLILIGFTGVLLPGIPGLFLFFLASLLVYWLVPGVLSGWTVLIMLLGFLGTFPIDILGTMIGAKWGRATKWGLMGATIGGFVGLFFGAWGLLAGPILGAFIAEVLFKRRTLKEAATAGAGAGMGLFISTAGKTLLAFLLIAIFVIDIFFVI